jgi:hypothetical protein
MWGYDHINIFDFNGQISKHLEKSHFKRGKIIYSQRDIKFYIIVNYYYIKRNKQDISLAGSSSSSSICSS